MQQYTIILKRVGVVGILFALIAAAYGYLWYSIDSTKANIATLETAIADAAAADRSAENAESALVNLQKDEAKLMATFLDENSLVGFLEEVEGLGAKTGAIVKVLSVNGGGQNYQLSVSAEGSWSAVYHVLTLIETLPVSVTVQNVRLNKQGGDTPKWQAVYDFTVSKK